MEGGGAGCGPEEERCRERCGGRGDVWRERRGVGEHLQSSPVPSGSPGYGPAGRRVYIWQTSGHGPVGLQWACRAPVTIQWAVGRCRARAVASTPDPPPTSTHTAGAWWVADTQLNLSESLCESYFRTNLPKHKKKYPTDQLPEPLELPLQGVQHKEAVLRRLVHLGRVIEPLG